MKIMSCLPSRTSTPGLRFALNKTLAISAVLGALLAMPAFADEAADVSRLLRAGQLGEAMVKADAFLAQRPRDAQMRFLKGVILTEQNKSAEAITIFAKLTDDFPDLPEPYNNLAVLYAASGQYDKARAALDAAIHTSPAYATAYENLGDVHAKLASQAYDKALQLDSGTAVAKSKLTLLRSLAVNGNNSANPKLAAAPTTPPPPVAAKAPPVVVVVAQAPKTAPPTVPVVQKPVPPAPVTEKPATVVVVAAKPQPVKPEAKPVRPTRNEDANRDEVLNVVDGWTKAWGAQDVKNYLSYYGNDFQTPNGESHKAWADERQARIAGKGRISIKVESPQVAISGNTATVKFRQVYVSDRVKANSRKTLILTKQGGKWKIKQERTGS